MTRLTHTVTLWTTVLMLRTLSLAERVGEQVARPGARSADDNDRGDVPGWVMITVMTAIVTIALLAVFQEQVENAVRNAFDSVNRSGKTNP